VSGPLRVGSTVTFTSLGVCTPYYNWEHDSVGPTLLYIGPPLASSAWVDLMLWIDHALRRCPWTLASVVAVVAAPVNASSNYVPMQIAIPNDPALVGTTWNAQAACWAWWETYSISPGAVLAPAVELAIG
jgi:hypothetical protein